MPPAPKFVQASAIPADKLEKLRMAVSELRTLEVQRINTEELIETLSQSINELRHKTLPDLFDECGAHKLGIGPNGNEPGFEANLLPFYAANIAADWPPEKRQKAFKWLTDNGHGDLIKTEVKFLFPREKRQEAVDFAQDMAADGLLPEIKETVPHQTLGVWLKEQVEHKHEMPPLELIGGVVGRVVRIKDNK